MKIKIVILLSLSVGIFHCSSPRIHDMSGKKDSPLSPLPAAMHYVLPTYYITTSDSNARMGSLSLVLVYDSNDDVTAIIKTKIGDINTAVDGLLRNKKYDDLDSVEDQAKLVREIERKVNETLEKENLVTVKIGNLIMD